MPFVERRRGLGRFSLYRQKSSGYGARWSGTDEKANVVVVADSSPSLALEKCTGALAAAGSAPALPRDRFRHNISDPENIILFFR
jgi:hypothetical protein